MGKKEWIKTIALILLGICIDRLLQPNPQVQAFLHSIFAFKLWGIPVDTITLIILGVAILLLLIAYRNSKKAKSVNTPPEANMESSEKQKRQELIKETIKELKDEGILK